MGRAVAERDRWKIAPYVAATDNVVEFGCGGGFVLEQLGGAAVVGVEANDAPREAAQARGLDVRAGLVDVESSWADLVWSHHVLEHVLDPYDVLREMRRVLRSGGRLRLCLPIDDWRNSVAATGPDVNGHLWTWTPLLVHNLLAEAGFVVDDVRVVAYSWPRGSRVLMRWPRVFRAAAGVAGRLRRSRELHVCAVKP
jgi:SAM-dependent methyltransferase